MYSNEAVIANLNIHDDFKLEITLWSRWFIQKYFSVVRAKRNVRLTL